MKYGRKNLEYRRSNSLYREYKCLDVVGASCACLNYYWILEGVLGYEIVKFRLFFEESQEFRFNLSATKLLSIVSIELL